MHDTPADVRRVLDEFEAMKLRRLAYGWLLAWRRGFACYMMLVDMEAENPESRGLRVELPAGRTV